MNLSLKDLEPLVALAEQAGEAILAVYRMRNSRVHWKEDRTPLTEADEISHRVILEGLEALTPHIPVISEEGKAEDRAGLQSNRTHWLVDPLDGTKEFLKQTGEFTVNIALVSEGRTVAGVVHAPVLGQSWIGGVDGAERISEGERVKLRVRPAQRGRLGLMASRDHAGPKVLALMQKLPEADTLFLGSSLKFCLIAEGRGDLYLRDQPTMEWDTGAAQAVLEGAGGAVYTLAGQVLRYEKKGRKNPPFVAVGDPDLDWQSLMDTTTQTK